MWKALAREATSKTEKLKLITGLAQNVEDWAFAVVEFFAEDDDDDVSFKADKVLEHMADKRRTSDKRKSNREDDDDADKPAAEEKTPEEEDEKDDDE
jgi:hypothetical protein